MRYPTIAATLRLRVWDDPAAVLETIFSPGGRTVADVDSDGVIRTWDARTECENPGALLRLAATRVTRRLSIAEAKTFGVAR